jgi:hypothetical protein
MLARKLIDVLRAAMVEGEVVEVKEKLKAAQMEAARLTTERDQARRVSDKAQRKLKKTLTLREVRLRPLKSSHAPLCRF